MQKANVRFFNWLVILLIALLSVSCTLRSESESALSSNEMPIQLSDLDVTTGRQFTYPLTRNVYCPRPHPLIQP